MIITDGVLHYLLFEALLPEAGDRYLAQDYDITYAPSASVYRFLRTQKPSTASRDVLAYGDPDYGDFKQSPTLMAGLQRAVYKDSGYEFVSLPGTRIEVNGIKRLFGLRSTTLLDAEATKNSLKSENLSRYKILHFAAHAIIDDAVPSRSGIVLSTAVPDGDAVLRANEIFNLRLDADLVALSACQTGLGKMVKGEGMVGMTHAFFYAGARTLAVSLWPVDDPSTSTMMICFYQHLKNGDSPSKSLQAAKVEMLRSANGIHRHPYFWTPFVIVGR